MLAVERLKRIRNYLQDNKTVDIVTMSNILRVSEATVRRDFEKLEQENFLVKTHGGAILTEDDLVETDFENKQNGYDEYFFEKTSISDIASFMVNDNSTVILCSGSVCKYIARKIKLKNNLTVVTIDLTVASELAAQPSNVRILLPGGDLNVVNHQLSGAMTMNNLSSLYFDSAFIDVDGVTIDKGYFVDSIDKAYIIKEILRITENAIAVCDYSKFNKPSFCHLGSLNLFKKVISNEQTPDEFKKYYFENNIKLITTFNALQETIL